MANKFTQKAEGSLLEASKFSRSLGHSYVGTEHLLYALASAKDSVSARILTAKGAQPDKIRQDIIDYMGIGAESTVSSKDMTPRLRKIIESSADECMRLGNKFIGTEHLLTALINQRDCTAVRLLEAAGISVSGLKADLATYLGLVPNRQHNTQKTSEEDAKKSKRSPLSLFGKDLTAAARASLIDPVIGRDAQIERLIRILCRRQKNNPCIIGEPGVGKTAIVEGLARRIAEGKVPSELCDAQIYSLDLPSMLAGAKYRGEFEERMKGVIDEMRKEPDVILFIDEVHILVGAGGAEGAIDAANILKPPLARGDIHIIGATTPQEYRSHIEKDTALERRLQPIILPEPSEDETVVILKGLRSKYEQHHNVKISDDAICGAVRMSLRYIPDRRLPDKAIDLIDEAAARLKISMEDACGIASSYDLDILERQKELALIEGNIDVAEDIARRQRELSSDSALVLLERQYSSESATLTSEHIAQVITEQTGIPCKNLLEGDVERLQYLEQRLSQRVIGQEEAIRAVSDAIRRGRTGLGSPKRPIGSFLFLGSTGIGKTELCRALAQILFEKSDALVQIDMSEYMEKHSISKLIGAPPGYVGYGEGGILTEKIRRQPYSVILFDEIEKAHPDLINLLLQILEDGVITDSSGRQVHFSDCVIIMTSNLLTRAEAMPTSLGFSERSDTSQKQDVRRAKKLNEFFRPEFLNRIDEVILFSALGLDELTKISEIMINELCERASELGTKLCVDDGVARFIAQKCFEHNKELGARPLRREITESLETPLAKLLLSGRVSYARALLGDDGVMISGKCC